MKISGSVTVTTTDPTTIVVATGEYIAFLKRLKITNLAASANTVSVIYFNGDIPKIVMVSVVGVNEEKVYDEKSLPIEAAPTAIAVRGTAQPYVVDFSVELL